MKSKEFKELKSKSVEALKKEVSRLIKEKNEAKIERDMTKTKDLHRISKVRRDIARMMTLLSEKAFLEKSVQVKGKEKINAS